ncbi:MAG: DUF4159 domain-containing protein [Ignavibacteriaceae bacterium]|nr:DUF4159 domain-containing protein [Ignavibacteriaceae bacterium]
MKLPLVSNIAEYLRKREEKQAGKLVFESSRWRISYKRAFGYGILLSSILHLGIIGWVYFFSEKNTTKVKTIKIKTYYEKIPPPIKYEPTPPKLAKSFDMVKEQATASEYEPKDYSITEAADISDLRSADIRPSAISSSVGGQGSVFHGAFSSGETGGAEGWSIPGGTRSYGHSLGRGGTGGLVGRDDGSMSYGPDIVEEVSNTRGSGRPAQTYGDDLLDYSNFKDRWEGKVVQGRNKKDVRGNLNLYQLQYRASKLDENGEPSWNVVPQALPALVEYAQKKTKIDFELKGAIRLDDKLILEVPIVYMMGSEGAPVYSQVEVKNLEKYLRNGGFLFIDDGYAARWGAFNQKARKLVEDALGYDAEWEKIPNNHWLYHCWEDFEGPPPGEDEVRPNSRHPVKERYRFLEGIFLNGRLAVLISSKGYCKAWGDWPRNPSSLGGPLDNTRQLQFGLNVVIFACTQKGGIIDRQNQRQAAQK